MNLRLQVDPDVRKSHEALDILVAQLHELNSLRIGVQRIANECNCRWQHGAEGAEHLKAIEAMLNQLLE